MLVIYDNAAKFNPVWLENKEIKVLQWWFVYDSQRYLSNAVWPVLWLPHLYLFTWNFYNGFYSICHEAKQKCLSI